MDTFRLFLRSNSFRISKNKKFDFKNQYLRTNSSPDQMHDQQTGSSSAKIQSFLSKHPSSIADLTVLSKPYFDLETCSGLSTPPTESSQSNHRIAASASQSIANVRSFTHHSTTMRRTKSYRYSNRIRKSSREKIVRRHSQVNKSTHHSTNTNYYFSSNSIRSCMESSSIIFLF